MIVSRRSGVLKPVDVAYLATLRCGPTGSDGLEDQFGDSEENAGTHGASAGASHK
jgi:hypothetical protein